MDGLSVAASVIAVIDLSAKITSLCFHYATAVRHARKDIERLQRKVGDINNVFEQLKQLLDGRDITLLSATHNLSDSLRECLLELKELKMQLEPVKTRKSMSRFGVRALQWPLTSKEVEMHLVRLERYEQTYTLALQADQTHIILDLNQKTDKLHQQIDFSKLPVAKGASFDSHIEEHNARCFANTRVDLQRQIKEWAKDGNGKHIFWLNGMAGTGKSTIARTVARLFAKDGQLGASFFFKKGEGDCGTASRFFTTIAMDLMAHMPGLIPGITKAIDADPTISGKTLKDQFEKLIMQPLLETRQASPKVLIVIIDALDECEREEDIQVILQLLTQTRGLGQVSLRIFVTSRPELPIRLAFKKMLDGTYQDLILQDIPKETIKHDIALYLEHELKMISEHRSLPQSWPSKDQIQALVEMAIPLFIFAATACRYIGEKRDNPKKRLEIFLQYATANQVSRLDKTYLPILNQLFNDEDELDKERRTSEFREVVGSIVVLESPLSIASLAHLLNIPKEDISCRLDLLHSVLNIPFDEVIPIRLLHLSFRDFLLDTQKRGKSPFWVDEKETHKMLARKCLQLLSSSKGLRQNMCNQTRPGTLRSEIDYQIIDNAFSREVQYACRYWTHHLKQSGSRIYDGGLVDTFLQSNFLYWLEAMSLIGKVSESIYMINSLQSLTNTDESAAISDFLHDGKRFVLRSRSILEYAPLQLYSSALIFAPEMSIIRKTFERHIPIWITKLPKVQKDWDALLQTLEGHSKAIKALAFSPNGQLVASASRDKTVRLWDAGTGFCRNTLEGHSDDVSSVAFSWDGQLIASSSDDKTVRLWDASTGSCCSILEGHSAYVNAVVFSPNGQLVASASDDNTVRLWDSGTGSCHSTLEGHSYPVRAVAFCGDGHLIASGSDDYTLRLWDASTGFCQSTFTGHSNSVVAIAFCQDGQLIASASYDHTVRLWNIHTGSCRSTLIGHSSIVTAVVFSQDGQLMASASNDYTVRLWNVDTGSCHSTLIGHSDSIRAVVFSQDGQLVTSASRDNEVRLWDTGTGFCRNTLQGHLNYVGVVVFSPDGKLVAFGSNDNTVRLWDTGTESFRSTLESHSDYVNAVAFSLDGQLVASASHDNTVRLWDVGTGVCRNTLKGHSSFIEAVVFSPDCQLVVSASVDNTVRLWDSSTGSCRHTLKGHSGSVRSVVFSQDGQLLASASDDSTVRLWDVGIGSCRSTLEGHLDGVYAIVFSRDGQLVASASNDNTVRLWDAGKGSCSRILEGLWGSDVMDFSPDGQLVASASYDNAIQLWEVGTGSIRNTLEGHSEHVTAIAFSPNGQLLATAAKDNTVRLWNAVTGSCLSRLTPGGIISTLSFSLDCLHLETDRGQVLIPLSLSNASSYPKNELCALFVKEQWVASQGENVLWLPSGYRPTCTAVYGNVVCLGHASGNVTILGLNSDKRPSH